MDEDILPKVEKLKRDRNNYLEFQKIGKDIDNLKRKLVAYDFMNSQANAEKCRKTTADKQNEFEIIIREIKETNQRIDQLKEEYDQMERHKSTVRLQSLKTILINVLVFSKRSKIHFLEIWR